MGARQGEGKGIGKPLSFLRLLVGFAFLLVLGVFKVLALA